MLSSDLREARRFREPVPDGRNAAVAVGHHVDLGPISVQSPFNAAPPYADIMKHVGILAFAPALAFAAPLGVFPHAHALAQYAAKPQLAAVSAHLKAMKTMTADLSQTGQNGQTITSKLTTTRPGKIRFQYQPGVPPLVRTDG